jgi:hypothetical protein
MAKIDKVNSLPNSVEPWYSLEDQDILDVAEDMEVKLSKSEILKVKELAPDYIDWFGAIENAIVFIKENNKKNSVI